VPHVRVQAYGAPISAVSDDDGRFRFPQLMPGLYELHVFDPHEVATGSTSWSVAVGEHVDGVVVQVVPGFVLSGHVVIDPSGEPCAYPTLTITHGYTTSIPDMESAADGGVRKWALVPGTYGISVACDHYVSAEHYEDVVITDHDVVGLTWKVTAGGSVSGKAVDSRGNPLAGMRVSASEIEPFDERPAYASTTSAADGSFVLSGLRSAPYTLAAAAPHGSTDDAEPIVVDVIEGSDTRQDIVVDASASEIVGHVRFADGALATRIGVELTAVSGDATHRVSTDDAGRFATDDLHGDFRVTISDGDTAWPLAGAGATGLLLHLVPGATNSVELTTTKTTGEIRGNVIDELGRPVADAFVAIAPYDDDNPAFPSTKSEVVVDAAGSFRADKLTEPRYRVRAYRKSGGESVALPVALGGDVTLTLTPAAAISGTVRLDGAPVQHFRAELTDPPSRAAVQELEVFALDGRFALHGVATGHHRLTITADGTAASTDVDVAAGNAASVALALLRPAHVHGRIVARADGEPVEGVSIWQRDTSDRSATTDATGRFDLEVRLRGPLTLDISPAAFPDETKHVVVDGDELELGDIPVGSSE
jgi:hypothetical protein